MGKANKLYSFAMPIFRKGEVAIYEDGLIAEITIRRNKTERWFREQILCGGMTSDERGRGTSPTF